MRQNILRTPLLAAALGITAVLASLAVVACAQPAAQSAGPVEVRVITTEWDFQPATVQVPAGVPVTFILQNDGVIEHDIEVHELDFHLHANARETVRTTVTFEQAGTYSFICTIPGHKEAGMVGTLVVGEPVATAPVAEAQQTRPVPEGLDRLPIVEAAPPVDRDGPALVQVELETIETTALLDDGVAYTFWTFDGTVPGPMIRVRQGDTVELTLKNAPDSRVTHSIDLHAVTGPGGGAAATQIAPGEEATFRFQALNPGVYVYHCATPMVAHHIASGMYGLIVVEPPEGLPAVDREFYVMQGDFYLHGDRGEQGHRDFSMEKMLDERADYVLFNGAVGAVADERALKAEVGETVRIFFGVGGPNLTSSFHVIGEIFDRVHPEGASDPATNVQTTLVPAGGATMVEFTLDVPGNYILVDHSLGRLEKGGAAFLVVDGAENPSVFEVLTSPGNDAGGH